MQIVNVRTLSSAQLTQAARLLTDALPLGWPDFESAMLEISERLIPGNTLLAALEDGRVVGWGGILPIYGGHVFELHPLVVDAAMRRMGVGRALMAALEQEARERGGLTMYIGADDEREGGETSLGMADLYDDLPARLRDFEPRTHQAAFYQKLGYTLVGVLPDANGRGKPDLFLAKRL